MQPTTQPGTIVLHGTQDRRKTIGLGNLKKCTLAVEESYEASMGCALIVLSWLLVLFGGIVIGYHLR